MSSVDKSDGARPAVRIGVAGLLGAAALAAAAASVAQDRPAPSSSEPPASPETPAPAQPPTTPPQTSQPAAGIQPVAPGQAPAVPSASSASAAATPPDAVQDCAACHGMSKDAPPSIGPNLWGVVGRQAGSTNYPYSAAMKAYGQTWTPEILLAFIQAPATVVPGTAMDYPGISDPTTAKAVVDYLATLKD